jgi:hypothetical protein
MNQSPVAQPGNAGWIASLMKQLLEEMRVVPVSLAARTRIAEIQSRSVTRLERGLALDLVDELSGMTVPFCGQRRQATTSVAEQDHPVSRIDRLLDNIETSQFGLQRQRRRSADARRSRDASAVAPPRRKTAPQADRHSLGDPSHGHG